MGLKDYFTFGGENCSDYGVHASGQSTFDAPVKEYESYSIPGRSGDLKIFDGRYSNIKVTYPCVYDKVGNDFSKDIEGLRNALLCKDGYQRLWDSHHPDEYRLGIYEGGLEVDPTSHGLKATFDVEFDCKPQRYLTSGEVAVPVANNGKITNPTRFPSSPLLEVTGYGTINIAGQKITIGDYTLGRALLTDYAIAEGTERAESPFLTKCFHVGDAATVSAMFWTTFSITSAKPGTITKNTTHVDNGMIIGVLVNSENGDVSVQVSLANKPFGAGTVGSETWYADVDFEFTNGDNIETSASYRITATIHWTEDSVYLNPLNIVNTSVITRTIKTSKQQVGAGYVESTMSTLGEPMYIDLDTGDAYKIEDGERVLVNYGVSLGTELPVLKPGVNKIKYSNTVTNFKIAPRWWRL